MFKLWETFKAVGLVNLDSVLNASLVLNVATKGALKATQEACDITDEDLISLRASALMVEPKTSATSTTPVKK